MLHRSFLPTALLLALAACDCSASPTPTRPCVTTTDCASGEICLDGTCTPMEETRRDSGTDTGPDDTMRCGPEPWETGVEICDGRDNDCDGVIDNGVLNSCGTCEPGCEAEGVGPGTDDPYMPGMDNSEGVSLDPEGALVLDSRRINTNFIWIASTNSGEVSKVDTTTFTEVARYQVGTDPSRTSVNSVGDVYVGNRGGLSVTKISALGTDCPDTNGDGVITTSTGAASLPWGQDDCVLWRTDLPSGGIIRAVAAQDVEGPDGELIPYVWAGGWNGRIYKLDGRTGAVVLDIPAPTPTYGFAIDGRGRLWMASLTTGFLGFIDTNLCTDSATCGAAPVCTASGPEGTECDGAGVLKGRIPLPDAGDYGITVDFNQRIWLGGWAGGLVKRYDPAAPSGSRWVRVVGAPSDCNGVGADAEGFVWAACESNNSIVRIDANNPASFHRIPTGPNRGIGIDADGKVWGILRHNAPAAVVIRPGAAITDNPLDYGVGPTLALPYTYSDMTGLQLRLATNPRGHYRHVFEGCEGAEVRTDWSEIHFDAETPAGTEVIFRVRTADSRAELDTAEWVIVGTVPPGTSPLSIRDALAGAGVMPARFLMLEVQLRANRSSSTEVITPRVLGIDVHRICSGFLL
ncbi:MAG: hypothetical protein KF901_29555 [Myxococcales bacterium]|nr:hypothetical protein [Myxococcales bacterium]